MKKNIFRKNLFIESKFSKTKKILLFITLISSIGILIYSLNSAINSSIDFRDREHCRYY